MVCPRFSHLSHEQEVKDTQRGATAKRSSMLFATLAVLGITALAVAHTRAEAGVNTCVDIDERWNLLFIATYGGFRMAHVHQTWKGG